MKRHTLYALYIALILAASLAIIYQNQNKDMPTATKITTAQSKHAEYDSYNYSYPIDLNNAEYEDLILIEEIDKDIANSIIEYRNNNGDFIALEELMKVYGIGEVTYQKISPYFYVKNTAQSETTTTTKAVFKGKINLNTGTYEDFLTIPILSEDQAAAIIELRETIDYFSHYYELLYAEGFNESLVAQMNDYVYVEGHTD